MKNRAVISHKSLGPLKASLFVGKYSKELCLIPTDLNIAYFITRSRAAMDGNNGCCLITDLVGNIVITFDQHEIFINDSKYHKVAQLVNDMEKRSNCLPFLCAIKDNPPDCA